MFHAILRPGQGFRSFLVLTQPNDVAANGRPLRHDFTPVGLITGLLMRASQNEVQQWKPRDQWNQEGHPVIYKIIQYSGVGVPPLYALLNRSTDQPTNQSIDQPPDPSPEPVPVILRAKPTDVLQLLEPTCPAQITPNDPTTLTSLVDPAKAGRFFLVQGVHDPAAFGHFVVYYVQERVDFQGDAGRGGRE